VSVKEGLMGQSKKVVLRDGDDLIVIVALAPSAFDPAQEYLAVGLAYRVVANSNGPTLTLVPLAKEPGLLRNLPAGFEG